VIKKHPLLFFFLRNKNTPYNEDKLIREMLNMGFKKFKLVTEIEILVNPEIDRDTEIKELLHNGDVVIVGTEVSLVDGESKMYLRDDDDISLVDRLMASFNGGA